MDKHLRNLKYFGQTVVVAFTRYGDDSEEEVDYIRTHCEKKGVGFAVNNAFTDGGEGLSLIHIYSIPCWSSTARTRSLSL